MSNAPMGRREFLGVASGTFAALVTGKNVLATDDTKKEAPTPSSLETIFKDIKLTDQYGAEFKPLEVFKGKPALVLFGYNGCPRCQIIADSVAAIQQKLIGSDKDVPIMVVSVQPEQDSKGENLKPYIEMYYEKGVRQFKTETLLEDKDKRKEQGAKAFDDLAKKKPEEKKAQQTTRLFHIVCPETSDQSKDLQTRISTELRKINSRVMLMTDPKDAKQHTSFITLFDANGNVKDAKRMLDRENNAADKHRETLAKDIAEMVTNLDKDKNR